MKVGTKLNLLIKDPESNQIIEYRCNVIGIDSNYIFIDYPINKDTQRTAPFPNGTFILATYIDTDKNLYQFQTNIQKRITLTIPGLAINIPKKEKIKQVQRREYVRIMTAVDIAIHPTDQTLTPFTTVTHDISGGGVSAVIPSKMKLKKGQILSLWMVLHIKSEIKYVHLQGSLIHMNNYKSGLQTASIKFISVTDQIRQSIIQFCFEKQREARKKELI